MKIGIDTRQADLPASGASVYTRGLVDALLDADTRHCFQLYALPGSVFSGRSGPRVEVICAPQTGSYSAWTQFALPNLVSRNRPDIFYTPICSFPLLARLSGTPQAVTVHDLCWKTAPESYSFSRRLKHRLWLNIVLRKCAAVFAASGDTAMRCLDMCPAASGRVHIVHPGLQPVFLAAASGNPAPAPAGGRPVFFCPGGASLTRKRFDRAAEAIALLRKTTGKDIRLIVSGRVHPGYEGLIKESAWIQPAGCVSADELVNLYLNADAVFFPSPAEGYGFPVVEATALGRPVIVPENVPAARELFADSIIAIPENADAQGVARVCERIFAQPEDCRRLAAAGRGKALKVTWARAARQVLAFLEQTADKD